VQEVPSSNLGGPTNPLNNIRCCTPPRFPHNSSIHSQTGRLRRAQQPLLQPTQQPVGVGALRSLGYGRRRIPEIPVRVI